MGRQERNDALDMDPEKGKGEEEEKIEVKQVRSRGLL